jgi:hypothetical protein
VGIGQHNHYPAYWLSVASLEATERLSHDTGWQQTTTKGETQKEKKRKKQKMHRKGKQHIEKQTTEKKHRPSELTGSSPLARLYTKSSVRIYWAIL